MALVVIRLDKHNTVSKKMRSKDKSPCKHVDSRLGTRCV